MEMIDKKTTAVIFLAATMFFFAAQKTEAVSADISGSLQDGVSVNVTAGDQGSQDSGATGSPTDPGGIVQCGRGQTMCTLCDLIRGFNIIIQYIMKIAIGVAILAIAIGGVMYVVSAGDTGTIDTAKKTIQNALIGFVVIFSGYLIINTTIVYLGTRPGMGINAHWGTFTCDSTAAQHVQP